MTLDDEDPRQFDHFVLRHPSDHTKSRTLQRSEVSRMEAMHVEVMRDGQAYAEQPELETIRQRRIEDVERLDPGIRRLVNPHIYHVSLTPKLWNLKQQLIAEAMQEREG